MSSLTVDPAITVAALKIVYRSPAVTNVFTDHSVLGVQKDFVKTHQLGGSCHSIRVAIRDFGSYQLTKEASREFAESSAFRQKIVALVSHPANQLSLWDIFEPVPKLTALRVPHADELNKVHTVVFAVELTCVSKDDWVKRVVPILRGDKSLFPDIVTPRHEYRVEVKCEKSFHYREVPSTIAETSLKSTDLASRIKVRFVALSWPAKLPSFSAEMKEGLTAVFGRSHDFDEWESDDFCEESRRYGLAKLNPVCNFPDLETLKWPPSLTKLGPMPKLRDLSLSVEVNFQELSILPLFVNLKSLELVFDEDVVDFVDDLDELKKLPSLESLCLKVPHSDMLDFIAGMTGLKQLTIISEDGTDWSGLSHLVQLQVLSLRGSRIADLNAINKLRNLKNLDISQTRVQNLSPLSNLQSLESLNIAGTPIKQVMPLVGLVALKYIESTVKNITDIHAFLERRVNSHVLERGIYVGSL